jgi:serine/threonine protein kinase
MSSSRWIGKTLGGRYQIEALLGQGGMSAVYKATDPNLNRAVAIKLIHPHLSDVSEFVDRFREEANVVAQLRHPNIVQVFDFNRDGDDFYMVMEFVAGETMRDRLNRLNKAGDQMPLVDIMNYAINITSAIDYAHRRNLIHRDIKPANVMLDLQDQAILMDFGIAKIMGGPQFTATGATIGTALYMSPEQIRGERIDERSDLYATGVMLFEMIGGQPPFQAESPTTLMMMHLGDPVPDLNRLRPDCPAELKAVVNKALVKAPDQRYQHAADMSAALRQALSALQRSLQAPTVAGNAAVASTALPRTVQAKVSDATVPPKNQPPTTGVAPTHPPAVPPQDYTPPQVVSGGRSKRKLLIAGGLLLAGACALISGLLLILFILNLSGGIGSDVVAEVDATGTSLASLPVENTEMPTNEPTLTTPSPTETPAPTATLEPTATPTPRRLGLMTFRDNEQARAGNFQLTIAEAGSPAAGSHYELWISDGQSPILLGAIEPGSGINFVGNNDENLIAHYNNAFITVELDGQTSSTPSGTPVFLGFLPAASLEEIRSLVGEATESPGGKGYLIGADEQVRLAIDHSGFLAGSLAAGDLATAKLHAEHVVNILAGEENSAFGDLNGDGLAQNPGDGFGVAAYLEKAKEHAQLAAAASNASEEVKLHAGHTIIGTDNALAFLEEAIRAAGRVLASDSTAEAQQASEDLSGSLDSLLNGTDANNDGIIAPIPEEGGLLIAYEHALNMGSFEFFNAQDVTTRVE